MNSPKNTSTNSVTENGANLMTILAQAQSTDNMAAVIPEIIDELKNVWRCKAITLFALDRDNRQLFSRNRIENLSSEVRVDVSASSLAGYVAGVGKPINLPNAYSEEDLANLHPQLSKGSTLDIPLDINTQAIDPTPEK